MANGIERWMMSKSGPPIEDTGVFAGDWRVSPSALPKRVFDRAEAPVRWGEPDPMGSMLKACAPAADFETLLRLI